MHRVATALFAALLLATVVLLRAGPVAADAGVNASLGVDPAAISCGGSTTAALTINGANAAATGRMIDLVILLDSSGSVGSANWAKEGNAAVAMLDSLTLGPNDVQVGVINFSTNIRTIGLSTDKSALATAILAEPNQAGTSHLKDAVLAAETILNGGRANAKRVIVTITDGVANPSVSQDPATEATRIQAIPGWLMIGVGVDVGVPDATLNALSSDPDSSFAFRAATFDDVATTLGQIAALLTAPAATNLGYSMTTAPGFSLTSAVASADTAVTNGNSFTWSLTSLLTEQVTIAYTLQHTGAPSGALPLHQAATLAYTGPNNPVMTDYTTSTVTVTGCDATAPQVTPSISGTLGANGWYTSDVTVSWTVLDPESSVTSPACTPTTITANTAGQVVSCTAISAGGMVTETVTIKRDADPPPAPTPAVAPSANAAGWHNAPPVTVTFPTPADIGPSGGVTCSSPTTLTMDTAGTTVTGTCTDAAGNSSATGSATVKIDTTKPVISGSRITPANGSGWNNTPVQLAFTCAEAGPVQSGIATNTITNLTVSTESANQSATNPGVCTDAAGNSADPATISSIKIDLTKPVITATRVTPASAAGWNNTPVQVSFACAEAGPVQSGIATNTVTNVTLSAPGENQTATSPGVCTDAAGNSAVPATVSGISISTGLPEFSYQFDPATRGVQVFGLRSAGAPLSGAGPVNPTTCATQRTGKQCLYRVSDLAGNSVTVALLISESTNQTRVRIVSLQYSGRPAVTPLTNETVYDYRLNGSTLTSLVQSVTVTNGPSGGMPGATQTVRATWNGSATTLNFVKPSAPDRTLTGAQPLLVRIVSSTGTLRIDTTATP